MHSNSSFASNGGKTLTVSTQWQDTPALKSRAYPGALPSYQSVTHVGQLDHVLATQGLSSSTPLSWQGHDGTSVSVSHASQQPIPFQSPSSESFPLTMPHRLQAPEIQVSTTPCLLNTSEFGTPVSSSIASASVHPNLSASLSPVSLDMPSSLSIKSSLPHSASVTASGSNLSLFPSSCIDIKASEAQIVGKAVSDPRLVPVQHMPYPTSPFVDSLGPLLTPSPSLVSPDQLTQSRPRPHSSTQKLYPDKSDLSAPTPASSRSSPLISMPVSQAPLLPLPNSSQQVRLSLFCFWQGIQLIIVILLLANLQFSFYF
jgi:protein LSM14